MTRQRKPNHHNRKTKLQVEETVASTTTNNTEEYTPSSNADSYQHLPPPPQWTYRVISYRNDYIKLQEDVTQMLNQGWQLAGGISTVVYSDPYSVSTVFSQAIFKNA